jgi:spore maturation protein CgeB
MKAPREIRPIHYALYSVNARHQVGHRSVFATKDEAKAEATRLLNKGRAREVFYYPCDCDRPKSHKRPVRIHLEL